MRGSDQVCTKRVENEWDLLDHVKAEREGDTSYNSEKLNSGGDTNN